VFVAIGKDTANKKTVPHLIRDEWALCVLLKRPTLSISAFCADLLFWLGATMTSNKRTREQSLASIGKFCSEGVDFGTGYTGRTRNHKEDRKAKQLCRQVADTLDLVLSGDCRDELLQSLHVVSVVPAPNSSRLLVTVSADLPIEEFDRRQVLERLADQTGRLRSEVAASINRKRVPSLVFHVVGPLLESSL